MTVRFEGHEWSIGKAEMKEQYSEALSKRHSGQRDSERSFPEKVGKAFQASGTEYVGSLGVRPER